MNSVVGCSSPLISIYIVFHYKSLGEVEQYSLPLTYSVGLAMNFSCLYLQHYKMYETSAVCWYEINTWVFFLNYKAK